MSIVRFAIAVVFLLMALSLVATFLRVRRPGLILGAAAYAGGGLGAILGGVWWPLGAGLLAAFVLSRRGAEPAIDVRFDLPDIDRPDTSDDVKVHDYLTRWLAADAQVNEVRSPLIEEAWASGYRAPPGLPQDDNWHAPRAEDAWRASTAADLRQLAGVSRLEFIGHLDALGVLVLPTIVDSCDRALRYEVPDIPRDLRQVMSLIPAPAEQRAFLENCVAECLISARVRVLAWTFQQWHGERYVSPEVRT